MEDCFFSDFVLSAWLDKILLVWYSWPLIALSLTPLGLGRFNMICDFDKYNMDAETKSFLSSLSLKSKLLAENAK